MIPNSHNLSDYLHYFFTIYLPQQRGVSFHTRLSYKHAFLQLLRYWKSRFPASPDPCLDQFSVPRLLDFLTHLEKDLGNTAATRNTRLAALKSFFKMLALLQPRYEKFCRQILLIPLKRSPLWPFDCLEQHEVDTIFASVKTQTRDGYRDLCILRTLYNTGARASELCALRLADLDFHQKRLLLQGKECHSYCIPLRPRYETSGIHACRQAYDLAFCLAGVLLVVRTGIGLDPYKGAHGATRVEPMSEPYPA